MKDDKRIFSVSCFKATELIEKRSMVALSMPEKAKLWMHLSICKSCQLYAKQSKWMDLVLSKQMHTWTVPSTKSQQMDESRKEQIIVALNKQ